MAKTYLRRLASGSLEASFARTTTDWPFLANLQPANHKGFEDLVEAQRNNLVLDAACLELVNEVRASITRASWIAFGERRAAVQAGHVANRFSRDEVALDREERRSLHNERFVLVEDGDQVGHGLDFRQELRAVEDRATRRLQMLDQVAIELFAGDRIEAHGRIVEMATPGR